MRGLSAIAFVMLLASPVTVSAYTQEDVAACTPDAIRLCQQVFPNRSRVVSCLVQNRRKLGPACTQAFNRARARSSIVAVSAEQ